MKKFICIAAIIILGALAAAAQEPSPKFYQSVAWSPDDAWTAGANETGLYLFPSEHGEERVVHIPLVVQDLDWAEALPAP